MLSFVKFQFYEQIISQIITEINGKQDEPGSRKATGSTTSLFAAALKPPFAAFFSIRNLQSLPYGFGDYVHMVHYSFAIFFTLRRHMITAIAISMG